MSSLETLPRTWRAALSALTGIYLLSDPETGEARYVGQADSAAGFLGRWGDYARNGHGGNVAMKASQRKDYAVHILEIGTDEELFQKEERWKKILGTRSARWA